MTCGTSRSGTPGTRQHLTRKTTARVDADSQARGAQCLDSGCNRKGALTPACSQAGCRPGDIRECNPPTPRTRTTSTRSSIAMGLPSPHPCTRIHPADRPGPLQRCLHGQLGVECVSRHPRAAPATGRVNRLAGAGGWRRPTSDKLEPVAICRLKRVAADHKEDITSRLPRSQPRNGKRVACIGAGPASLPMGLPGPHPRSRIHPPDRAGPLQRRLHGQLGVNVFPGILGRTCDRPCEPACRRGRVEENNGEQARAGGHLPAEARGRRPQGRRRARACRRPAPKNGKRIACVGAGPASLTVARDLAPLGYDVTVFDGEAKAGGFMRTQIPRFRLPESGDRRGDRLHPRPAACDFRSGAAHRLDEGAAGRGLRRGLRRLRRAARARPGDPGPQGGGRPASTSASTGWPRCPSATSTAISQRVIVLGGGNTAMDCCRSARRLGASDVKVIVRSGFEEMKASPWEKEDAHARGHPDHQLPRAQGLRARGRQAGRHELRDRRGGVRRQGPAQPGAHRRARRRSSPATRCWSRSARRTPSRGSSATAASRSTNGACRCWTPDTFQSTRAERVLRRRRGLRPEEHHHRGGARPRGGGVDRPAAARRGRRRSGPPPMTQPDVAEDGHPRVELRQRRVATTCASRCRGPRPRRRWPASRSRSNWASTPPPPSRKRSAA